VSEIENAPIILMNSEMEKTGVRHRQTSFMSHLSTDEDFAGRANIRGPPETETEAEVELEAEPEASVVVGAVDEKDKRKRHRKKR